VHKVHELLLLKAQLGLEEPIDAAPTQASQWYGGINQVFTKRRPCTFFGSRVCTAKQQK
jgi:hypothetical protein